MIATWDEGFAARYDEWAAQMTEDVPFYARLAREAEGPIVELAVGNGRVAIPVARETGREVMGIDTSPSMLALAGGRGRGGIAARPARRRHARPRGVRARRPDLLPVPRTSPPADVGGSPADVRARGRVARAGRPLRVERLRLRPSRRRRARLGFDGEPFTDESREYVFVAVKPAS